MTATFVLVALALAFLTIVLGLERRRVVSGSVAIAAPQERVYELVSDLRTGWAKWNPLVQSGLAALEYAEGTIELRRDPAATLVTWRDELSVGANPLWKWLARAMDGLRQQNVTRGLAALKHVAEHGDERRSRL